MNRDFVAGLLLSLVLLVILAIVSMFTGCSGGWEVCGYEIDKL